MTRNEGRTVKIYRQGDVLLVATRAKARGTKVPTNGRGIVLAEGEVTGHAHRITDAGAELLHDADTEARFLRVLAEGGVDLIHEEHATITLPRGTYKVMRQVELTPWGDRVVAD
jgi:hypothetical protein